MELRFDLTGFSEYEAALVRLIAMLRDMRPFWPRLAPLFVTWMRERFASEGEFGGAHWAPLSPDYLERKMMRYPGKGILYATGDLRQAASRPVRVATPTSVTFIIDDADYTHGGEESRSVIDYHQQGTERMPARPIIPPGWEAGLLPQPMFGQVEAAAQEWIEEMAVKLGLK